MSFFRKREEPKPALKRRIEGYWKETAYITNEKRVEKLRELLGKARQLLEADKVPEGFDVFYQAKRQYILARKHHEIYFRRSWPGMILTLALLVLFGTGILLVWFLKEKLGENTALLLSALGGGVGGCTAVLIQVIDVDPDSEVVSKTPWYVIKPSLGAVLGLVTYFALIAGFSIFADEPKVSKQEGAVVIGFLAGFFESFSKGVLGRIAGQFIEKEEKSEPTEADEHETQEQPKANGPKSKKHK